MFGIVVVYVPFLVLVMWRHRWDGGSGGLMLKVSPVPRYSFSACLMPWGKQALLGHARPKGTTGHRPDLREVTAAGQGLLLQLTVGMIGQARLCQCV